MPRILRMENTPVHFDVFAALLQALFRVHQSHEALRRFAPMPPDLAAQPVEVVHKGATALLQREGGFGSSALADLQAAVVAAGQVAQWREHYRAEEVGQDFLDRFGCYPIIGEGGPYSSAALRAWIVYMPPHLYYPWHEHQAAELYLIISGSAVFRKEGSADVTLRSGDTVFHGRNQPHATETGADPVLCLVLWRDDFEHAPMLSDLAKLQKDAAQLALPRVLTAQ